MKLYQVAALVLSALAIGSLAGYQIKTPEQVIQTQTRTQTASSLVTVQIIDSLTQKVTEVATVTTSLQAANTEQQTEQIPLWHMYDWRDPTRLIVKLGVAGTEPVTLTQVLVDGVTSPTSALHPLPTGPLLPGQVWEGTIYPPTFAVGGIHTVGVMYSTPSLSDGFYGFNAVTGQSS